MTRLILAAFAASLFAACGPPPEPPTFTRVQEEIFELNCSTASCHGGSNPAAGLKLDAEDTHDNLVDQDASTNVDWKYVVAGDAEQSLLYKIVSGTVGEQRQMPPGLALDEDKLQLIFDWIDAGAAND